MKVLALDLGTRLGVAIGDISGAPRASVQILGDTQGARFLGCFRYVGLLIQREKPDLVVIEQPIAAGPAGASSRVELAYGLRAHVMSACHKHSVPFDEYPVATIKKYFIGKGNVKRAAAKAMTLDRCRREGWDVTSEDAADACAVWALARSRHGRIESRPPGGLFDDRIARDA